MPPTTPHRPLGPVGDLEPDSGGGISWATAVAAFLCRPTAPTTKRTYAILLGRIGAQLPEGAGLGDLSAYDYQAALVGAYDNAAPATFNLATGALRGLLNHAADWEWCPDTVPYRFARLARPRKITHDHNRALTREVIERLCTNPRHGLRERTLWRMLYETAARANEVLRLDVGDLDLSNRTAHTIRKGGDRDTLHYATGTARLLPRLLAGRTGGPVFLSSRPPRTTALPAVIDLDTATGHARLSYRQAAALFTDATNGATLHQLRHSALTHLANTGTSGPLLMAKSRHAALTSLQQYVHPSQTAIAQLTTGLDHNDRT
ncbi:site-specific integrase (plasmid) [Dermatophilaceae bacterium Sec6.4]